MFLGRRCAKCPKSRELSKDGRERISLVGWGVGLAHIKSGVKWQGTDMSVTCHANRP